jgi:hypothetical protein
VDQSGINSQVNIQMFDFNKQTGETTECDVVLPNQTCRFVATWFGPNGPAQMQWSATYFYGSQKNPGQPGNDPTFIITENCGGSGSTPEGLVVEVVVTLTVTDTAGNVVTVTTGQQGISQKFFRFRTCS